MNEGKRRVILNKVFPNASYMTQLGNLGHEIINLFKEDTGKFYIHLNPNGTYSDKDPVDILNISEAGKGLYQIISKAVNCSVVSGARTIGRKKGEDRYKQQIGHFKYGGEYIEKYFEQNVTMRGDLEKDLFVTFECDGIYEPKESVYIAFEESILPENRPKLYKLGMNWGRRPCRRYINESDDIIKLIEIIDNNDLWKESPIGTFDDRKREFEQKSVRIEENYFTFLGVDKQELQYSNALINILKFKPQFLSDFLKALSEEDCKNNNFDILREEKSIDLLFRDLDQKNGKIFIIENKIDADVTLSESGMKLDEQVEKWIRGIENIQEKMPLTDEQRQLKDKILALIASGKGQKPSQLSKYYVISVYWALKANWEEDKIKKDIYCYFLCPKYHSFNYKTSDKMLDMNLALSEKYQLITYEDIFNIFSSFSHDCLTDHQKFLLNDFIAAISMLAKERDDSMELKMIRLFTERYKKIKVKQGQTL